MTKEYMSEIARITFFYRLWNTKRHERTNIVIISQFGSGVKKYFIICADYPDNQFIAGWGSLDNPAGS